MNGRILWANLHLLFWLSLMPFVTRWMAETHFAPWPVSLYGLVLLLDRLGRSPGDLDYSYYCFEQA